MSGNRRSAGAGRRGLTRLLKVFSLILMAAFGLVLLDFAIDLRPKDLQSSYRFEIGQLAPDEVRILRRGKLSIAVARRSAATIAALQDSGTRLQDPESRKSDQPGYAANPLRSRHSQYFVSFAFGTDLGCPLEILPSRLKESCGSATYDLAGRALAGANRFPNLPIPDYNFSDDFNILTVQP